MKRRLSAARIAVTSVCAAATVAFVGLALPGHVTNASAGNSPQRADAAQAASYTKYSSPGDPLRKYYSPDDALRQDVVSGYTTGPDFPWSAQPDQTLQFHVSSYSPRYNVQMVRMFNANPDPHGPGIVETPISAPANGAHSGTPHLLGLGSYVTVPDHTTLRLQGSFTITAWIAPTTIPGSTANPVATVNTPAGTPRAQGLVTKWSGGQGYGLYLASDGSLALKLGTRRGVVTLATGKALRPWAPSFPGWKSEATNDPEISSPIMDPSRWYFVAASFHNGHVILLQDPVGYAQNAIPDPTRAEVVRDTSVRAAGVNQAPVRIGAGASVAGGAVTDLYNGKIDNPRIYPRALSRRQLREIEAGAGPTATLADWDFSRTIGSPRIVDISGNHFDGSAINLPASGVTGYNWDGSELDYRLVPKQYDALYFHQDDLGDAHWPVSFIYHVPTGLASGVYAAKLQAGGHTFYVPFFVTPPAGRATAHIALVMPTYSYLAYGMTGLPSTPFGAPSTLSLYSQHTDGSGVFYSTMLRPLTTMQPMTMPRHFSGDMQLVYWLHAHGYNVDILTDQNVNEQGAALLGRYRVVITGQHPEYPSYAVRSAYQSYTDHGGRLMYLGGNGFYWVTGPSRSATYIEVRRRDGTQVWQAAPGESHLSTTGEEGGLWRFRGLSPQQLVNVGFDAQGYNGPHGPATSGRPYTRTPASFRPDVAFIFAGIAPNERIGDFFNFYYPQGGAAGDEVDRADYTLGSPANTLVIAKATGFSDGYQYVVEELNQSDSMEGGNVNPLVEADMAYSKHLGGGAVFTVGSIAWDSSLLFNHSDNDVSRITGNVLTRFASPTPLP
jgi:N,N-dimethylformamidase